MSALKSVQKLVYKIIEAENTELLSVAVTEAMKLGWEPQGGVQFVPLGDYNDEGLLQAMIKTESALS